MYVDAHNRFSNAQGIVGSAVSTNTIDLSEARNVGVGERLYVVALVATAFTDTGSDSTVTVTMQTDATDAFGSATTTFTLGVFAALSAAGTALMVPIPIDGIDEAVARLYYTVANGNLTTGAITAFVTRDIQKWIAYPDAITIS